MMDLLKLSIASTFYRPISAIVSILLFGIGIAMMSVVLQLGSIIKLQTSQIVDPVDMVIGAKGSPLQLILSSVLHADNPTGNISLPEVNRYLNPAMIESAIPVSVGDNYKGFRLVGTDSGFSTLYGLELSAGNWMTRPGEVVVGSGVQPKPDMGEIIKSTHGLATAGQNHDHDLTVVGMLEPTGTLIDRLILTQTQTIWHLHHSADSQVTALLITFKNPMGLIRLPRLINDRTPFLAAVPALEMNRLQNLIGVGQTILNGVAILFLVMSALTIFIHLVNLLGQKLNELALLRVLGASPFHLFGLLLADGLLLSLLGWVAGWRISRFVLTLLPELLELPLPSLSIISLIDLGLLAGAVLIGLLSAVIPAIQAYRKDTSTILVQS